MRFGFYVVAAFCATLVAPQPVRVLVVTGGHYYPT